MMCEFYEKQELIEHIKGLKEEAINVIDGKTKGEPVPLGCEFLYIVAIVDKSIKLIDSFLNAFEKQNITVLAILTRVQMDCLLRAYALLLVNDPQKLSEDVLLRERQLRDLKDRKNRKMTDTYLAKNVEKWIGMPVTSYYHKLCGFVHFSGYNLHSLIHSIDSFRFNMTFFTEDNPIENKKVFERISLELGNQFYLYGELLISELFDSWTKQRFNG